MANHFSNTLASVRTTPETFAYGKDTLTASIALALARGQCQGYLSQAVKEQVKKSQAIVEEIAMGEEVVYGINSGFGPLCTTKISPENTRILQHNILKSHSVGVGDYLPKEIAKLMLILKVQALAQGYSGVQLGTLERLIWHVEEDVIPCIPEQGSVGASGDLAPLSHMALPLIGLGKVWDQDQQVDAAEVLSMRGMSAVDLGPKEGLALINGTQLIAALAVKVVERLHACLAQADLIAGLMLEGMLASSSPFDPALHQLRPYLGNQHVAARIYHLIHDSAINQSHLECDRVQDPYSLRCIPQVHGAARHSWLHLKELLDIELNAVTDNPVILSRELTISGGNFHGQPLAMPLDYAALAAAELGNISDRRIYLSLDGKVADIPKLLMRETGLNSGFMMLQYTSASLVSENKSLCFPASADSVPTSLGQEDHVSMGPIGGRKALKIIQNLETILAIELMCAAQAVDFHAPLRPHEILHEIHQLVREHVSHAEVDRLFADDIQRVLPLIREKRLLSIAERFESFHTSYQALFEYY